MTIFLNLFGKHAYAQQQDKIDSILNVLKKLPADSNKVLTYHKLSYLLNFIQYKTELARKYVDSAMMLSEKLNYQKGIIESHYHYGLVDMNEDNYAEALPRLKRYIDFYSNRGDSVRVARGLYCVGNIHSELGEESDALAIQLRILKIYENTGDRVSIARTLNSIANIYWRSNKYSQAISHYNKVNEIYKSLGSMARYGMGLQNLANVYVSKKSYDSARQLYVEALEIIKEHGSDAEAAYILANLGDLYEELKDYKQALSYNFQSLEIRKKLAQKKGLALTLLDIGYLYLTMKQYNQAEKYLNEGITMAESIGAKDLLQRGYLDLSDLFAAKKDFSKAYDYNKLSNQWKDSIHNETSIKQLNELQTRYNVSEKDKRITLLAKEQELQQKETQRQSTIKKAFIAGFILVIVLAALAIYAFRQRLLLMTKDNEIKEVNLKHQLTDLEMKALRAQINPHFLFNCLNSINRMIVKGENENASLYLKKFSKLVRLIVENVETNRVSLENELALIESYIQLEELRFKGKIEYEIFIDENIEKENTFLPPMVLQPFVENAIWHGLMHKETNEQGHIKIAVKEDNDTLLCTIEDNGVGRRKSAEMKEKNDGKTKSIGIKVTEERLKLLSKERITELIRIVDLKDTFDAAVGTRVEISIPIS